MDDNYPPYTFRDSDGKPQGILIDQWRLWEQKTGIKPEISAMDWGVALSRMQAGDFDVIDTIFKTEKRTSWLDFSQPYAKIEVPIFFESDISGITAADSLKGFPVAVKSGDSAIDILRKNGVENLVLFDSYEAIIRAAKEHKVNVFVVDKPPALYFLYKFGIIDRYKISPPLNVGEFHRGVKKGDAEILKLVEEGFGRIAPDELKQIETKWYGSTLKYGIPVQYIFISMGMIGFLALALFVWNRMLRRMVRNRTAALKSSLETQQANAAFVHTLINTIPDLIWLKDVNGVYLTCNRMFERFFGAKEADIVGKTDFDFVDKELADFFREHDRKAMTAVGPSSNEEWITFADDGHRALLETIKIPMYDAGGKLLGVLGIGRDITERKRAEDKLVRLTVAIEQAGETVVVTDAEGTILYVNPMFETVTGYSREEAVGRKPQILKSGEHDDAFYRELWDTITSGSVWNGQIVNRKKDGSIFIEETTISPVYDNTRRIVNYVAVKRDITAQKLAQQELDRHRDHLEELVKERTAELSKAREAAETANRAKSMFLANMSHEIRTPMNAMLGFAQLLARDPSLSSPARDKVATILKSGDHLLSIINDILEMSRIEAGRIVEHVESIDLHGLLDDLAVMFRMRAEQKGLAFSLDRAKDLPRYVLTDMGKLRQILINLLGNAVKFTKTGSIGLRACSAGIDRIAIEVQDSGSGINPQEILKLFQPFERTRSAEQSAGGTGLGLAISREYALLLGGDISVESQVDLGSCFRLAFHAQATEVLPASSATPPRILGLAPGQGEIRVLVVDDQDTNRALLREMLQSLGFIVEEAAGGEEAIEKAQTRKPRIILMDLVMPGMDGQAATQILRSLFPNDPPAIIGITASAFEDAKQQFIDAGIQAYIAKPFREQALHDALSLHAGVLFETEAIEPAPLETGRSRTAPTMEKMSPEWQTKFREALNQSNITRVRGLARAAQETDPELSAWILEQVGRYNLEGLKGLVQGRGYSP